MSATDVIRSWYDRVLPGTFMEVLITATQGGPSRGGSTTSLFFGGALVRGRQASELVASEGPVLLSDRRDATSRPIQPFNAKQADESEFTLLPVGALRERSITWNGTQDIILQDIGNNGLAGWGGSVGNTGQPSYWVVVVSNLVKPIPQ